MSQISHTVDSEHTLLAFQQFAAKMYHEKKWTKWAPSFTKRSLDVNALSHIWYAEISNQLGEDTVAGVKDFCKLNFGVPILRQHEKFNNFYTAFFVHLSYEKQLASMKYLSITSVMSRKEMNIYMNDLKRTYGAKGVMLSNSAQVK